MNFEVFTTSRFDRELKALAKHYRSIKSDFKDFKGSLEENPFQGTELSPGIRKIRMAIASKGKGKSGGARVTVLAMQIDFASEIRIEADGCGMMTTEIIPQQIPHPSATIRNFAEQN